MGSFVLAYYAKRPWDGGHLNMEVRTASGRAKYGINQDLDLRGFLLGGRQRRPNRREEADRGKPAIAFEVEKPDGALEDMSAALRAHDENEEADGYQVRLMKWKGGVSVDFSQSNTCADLLFLLLDRGFADEGMLQGFVSALRAHPMPTYTQLYLLAKWEERVAGKDARDEFQRIFSEKMREYPRIVDKNSDLFAGGGIALAGNGNYFFVYPTEGGEIVCRYDWQPHLDSRYSVEFGVDSGRLLSIDGRKIPETDAGRLLAAGVGGPYAVRNRLRCRTGDAGRRYETNRGKLVAEAKLTKRPTQRPDKPNDN